MKIPDKNRGKPTTIESVCGFRLPGSFLLSHPFINGYRHPLVTILFYGLVVAFYGYKKPGKAGLLISDDIFWMLIPKLFSKNTHFCSLNSSIFAD